MKLQLARVAKAEATAKTRSFAGFPLVGYRIKGDPGTIAGGRSYTPAEWADYMRPFEERGLDALIIEASDNDDKPRDRLVKWSGWDLLSNSQKYGDRSDENRARFGLESLAEDKIALRKAELADEGFDPEDALIIIINDVPEAAGNVASQSAMVGEDSPTY